ncbi:bifunctional DNA-binding transcriptional regulator/O6-methylguanine-DNA methyltransferase Ada [Stakelama sp. CBK3Z-3]|uniref:Bifunctional DNA-binding transcriptional regulator/O6-methylguanine-DNA methyltransferase Ada n=1 Tax=Stakelama flava TaxID=2860338 RepID=A0ABS6XM83_9SPHN|nr:bifunctional DNA-binding transcriptional regulator/O6-methylguanine-DNA methyltransferase Ada [Stakelama flava]MBW4331328.1 bifunctional DNA-binding transcriptional regulator/O6-methylguanine-DNA methyltransferase Ada [Stakelama flava]
MEPPFALDDPHGRDAAWTAFAMRDRSADGHVVIAVATTGVYCKPSCPARRPRRENVEFFADCPAARDAGYRACLRCHPDKVARDRIAVARAIMLIQEQAERMPLDALARAVGYAPHHFQRLFKAATGVSPAAYARALQATCAADALTKESSVTDAIYEAGYSGPGRFYENNKDRLGMTPGAWKRGGEGVTIRWVVADTSLGKLLVAATDKGLCRVSFDEDSIALARRFPNAEIVPGGSALADLAAKVVAEVETPGRHTDLPLDVQGTAFQEAVWQALRRIPAGETRSYAQLAAAIGKPGAVRAAGSACGANHVAVLIPCHRVQRGDGSMGGYAYGVTRKRALRKREGVEE